MNEVVAERENERLCEGKEVIISVCVGTDCVGVCGGAALIEIEELCQEAACLSSYSISAYNVVRSQCLGSCGLGPNVTVTSGQEIFLAQGIDSPSKCAAIVKKALLGDDKVCSALFAAPVGIMGRRAEGMRWKAVKDAYRDRMGGKHSYHSSWDSIKAAVAAEAVLPEDGSTERARRRLERLEAILQSLSRPIL